MNVRCLQSHYVHPDRDVFCCDPQSTFRAVEKRGQVLRAHLGGLQVGSDSTLS
jgi:hypothetical protein